MDYKRIDLDKITFKYERSMNPQERLIQLHQLFTRGFGFNPHLDLNEHIEGLSKEHYIKDCVIAYLENANCYITKKDVYWFVGLEKANESFNKFWEFLTRSRSNGQYLIFDKTVNAWGFTYDRL